MGNLRENFGYSGVEVVAPYKVTVTPSAKAVEPGQPINGEALIELAETKDGKPAPRVDKLVVRLLDNHDRALEQISVAAEVGKPASFTFQTKACESLQLRVEAVVLSSGRVAGSGWIAVDVLTRGQDRFNVVLWGGPTGPYAFWARQRLWQTGATSVMHAAGEDANLMRIPFIGGDSWQAEVNGKKLPRGLWGCGEETAIKENKCVNDPDLFSKLLDFQDRHWKGGQAHPVFVYNMYDEGISATCCQSPHCLGAYRGWLKEQYYDDLNALNTEWGSAYKSWDEVAPLDPKDNLEEEAKKKGNYARWSDRKCFGEVNFCRRMLGEQIKRAKKFDPFARLGFEASGEFGIEIEELLANSGFWCPYDGLQTELVRSLKPAGYVSGFWIGYDKDADPLIAKAWRMVMKGSNSIWWWMLPGRGKYHGWLAPNDEPYPAGKELLEECVLPLRRGLGDLMIRLDRPHDGVALYYSETSAHASGLGTSDTFSAVVAAHESLARLVQDCGYTWIYTTKKRLLAGDLQKQKIKLLVLPFTQALGQDEVDALRAFAEAGGIVLADLRPGVSSGHCRPLEHGPADALFGIERTGPGKAERMDGSAQVAFMGGTLPLELSNSRADAEIKAAGASVGAMIDQKPVFFVNRIGQGVAVLLNFHLNQDPRAEWWLPSDGERNLARGKHRRDFFRSLLAATGLKQRIGRTNGVGGELLGTETVTWSKGGVSLYGLYSDSSDATTAEIVLPGKLYAFDLRTGGKGLTDRVKIKTLRPGYAEFVAAYPYDPGKPEVRSSATTVIGGQTIEFAISMSGVPADESGIFSFSTRLVNPVGEWVDVIPWSAQGVGGKAVVPVKFAHNDMPGEWRLEVREVTTGRQASAVVGKKKEENADPRLPLVFATGKDIPCTDSKDDKIGGQTCALPALKSEPPEPGKESVKAWTKLTRETLGKDAKDYPPGTIKTKGEIGLSGIPHLVSESYLIPSAAEGKKQGVALADGSNLAGSGITVGNWGVWKMWNLNPFGCMGVNWVGADGKTKAQLLSPSVCKAVTSFQGDGWASCEMQVERPISADCAPKILIRMKSVDGDPNLYLLIRMDPAGGTCRSFDLGAFPYGYHDPKFLSRTRCMWVAGQDWILQPKVQSAPIQSDSSCGVLWYNKDCHEIGGLQAVFLPEEVNSVVGTAYWPCVATFELKEKQIRLAVRPWLDRTGWRSGRKKFVAELPDEVRRLRQMSFAWPIKDLLTSAQRGEVQAMLAAQWLPEDGRTALASASQAYESALTKQKAAPLDETEERFALEREVINRKQSLDEALAPLAAEWIRQGGSESKP